MLGQSKIKNYAQPAGLETDDEAVADIPYLKPDVLYPETTLRVWT
jgi:hypothetical protein